MASPCHLAIKGKLVIVGKEPDGDSVRFVADNPSHYAELRNGHRARVTKSDGSVQLRFEGVDAPELHYGTDAQPLGEKARDQLLRWIGFTNVEYATGTTRVTAAEPASVRAAILSKAVERNGRPVAFVLLDADAQDLSSGEWTDIDARLIGKTLNARLLESGMAYYTVYTSTPLRSTLRSLASRARRANQGQGRGVWRADCTHDFTLVDQASIGPEGQLVLPKLFRRCTDYLKAVDNGFDGNLAEWIVAVSATTRSENDPVVLADGTEVRLADLLRQMNSSIVFQPDLLDIAFVETS
ncbi:MAG TPA: thermonuclease family protein [Gaiellaceae bacterium]|jgi:endonuclease YncB( thermonuclease family)